MKSSWKKILRTLLFFGIALLVVGFGGWNGFRSHQYLSKKGCFPLASDAIAIDLEPIETIRFIAVGDVGTANADQKRVAVGMEKVCDALQCDFILLLGDNFMENGVTSLQDPLFQKTFASVYEGLERPFIPILGNHDVRSSVLAQVAYSFENPQWQMPNYAYQFEVGPARFFGINTNCNIFGWLPLNLQLDPPSEKWKFVYGHHAIYSSGVHGDNEWQVRWFWKNFLQMAVDFYLSGHNHHLEHLKKSGDDTEYIVSGAGGSHYRSAKNRAASKTSEAHRQFVYQDNGFVWFEVTTSQVQVKYFDAAGTELYRFHKKKT